MNTSDSKEDILKQLASMEEDEALALIEDKTKPFAMLMSYYRCAMMEIETKFKVLNEEYSLAHDCNPINSIKTRLKTSLGIQEKLKRRNLPVTLQAIETYIHDVAGIRVICNLPEDVYTLADAFLKQDDITLLEKKDYIANPKPNGYRSLHLIVEIPIFLAHEKRMMKAEIQLRTIAMDFWATLEHQLRYKKDVVFTEKMADELFACATLSAELDLRMEAVRKHVYDSENH